jgi:muramoyltetrapeptide carboxypeptidase
VKSGDFTFGVVSPAGPTPPEVFDAGVAGLQKLGFGVKVFPHARGNCGYLSAPAKERAADLISAWSDPEVDGILCARGGFGSAHILPLLPWERMKKRQLPLLGFSDVTALHLAMDRMGAGRPITAPMLKFIPDLDADSLDAFLAALEKRDGEFDGVETLAGTGVFSGRPLAGNLTVTASLLGTPYFPDPSGRVLVLEEVGEPLYRIDRMLTQLEQAGVFAACAGVVFGEFTEGNFTSAELRELLFRVMERSCTSAVIKYPFGHELPFRSIDFTATLAVRNGKIARLFA